MKARYIAIICLINVAINVIKLSDLLLIISSVLLLLLVFIPNLYVKIVNKSREVKESDRTIVTSNLANYGSEGISRIMNRIAIIVSLLVIYGMAIAAFLIQMNDIGNVVQVLSSLEWVIFILSLVLVTIHIFHLMRKETIF